MDKAAIGRRDSVGLRSLAASGTLAPVPTRTCAGHLLQLLGVCALLLLPQPAGQLRAAPQAPTAVPSPRDVLGFDAGRRLQARRLPAAARVLRSGSMRPPTACSSSSAGQSTEGREMLVAVISSEANLARLEHYRDIARRLALVRGLSDDEARALARGGQGNRLDRQRPARERGRDRAARDACSPSAWPPTRAPRCRRSATT